MKLLFSIAILLLFTSCYKENIHRNNFLPEARFSKTINIDLPLYNKLKIPLNAIIIDNENAGLRGLFVIFSGSNYYAWERACPHHPLNECSTMELIDNIFVKCPCDDTSYNLINGTLHKGNSKHTLINYRVSINGNRLTIYN